MQINSVPILWETQIRTITTDREVDGMRFCTKCGAAIVDDESQFCGECGEKIIKENISQTTTQSTTTTNFSPVSSYNGIVLESPTPIQSLIPQKESNIAAIAIILGIVGFLLQFTDDYYFAGRVLLLINGIGIFISYFIDFVNGKSMTKDYDIMKSHLEEMQETKYKFVIGVSANDIFNKIYPTLSNHYGNEMKFDKQNETVSMIYQKIVYRIILNDDGTFCIHCTRLNNETILGYKWIGNYEDKYSRYDNIRSCTAFIAYELQQQFGIN